MNNVFTYSKSGVCSIVEPSPETKLEKIKEAMNKALDTYRRHSVFTIAISKKGMGCFDCFVIPNSADLPAGINPAAFNFSLIYKHAWNTVPEKMIDSLRRYV